MRKIVMFEGFIFILIIKCLMFRRKFYMKWRYCVDSFCFLNKSYINFLLYRRLIKQFIFWNLELFDLYSFVGREDFNFFKKD